MPLLGQGLFIDQVKRRRVVYLAGGFGEGKTALACRIAIELRLNHGFKYIFSNIRGLIFDDPQKCVLQPSRPSSKVKRVNAVWILDEAGEFLSENRDFEGWFSYLRKINCVLILPSASKVAKMARGLMVKRTYDGYSLGLPYYRFGCVLDNNEIGADKEGEKIRHKFTWVFPSEVYGLYDTDAVPMSAGDLLAQYKRLLSEFAEGLGYASTASELNRQAVIHRAGLFSQENKVLTPSVLARKNG